MVKHQSPPQHKQAFNSVEHAIERHPPHAVLVQTLYMAFNSEEAAITWLSRAVEHLDHVGLDVEDVELITEAESTTVGITTESCGLTRALKAVRVLTAISRPRSEFRS